MLPFIIAVITLYTPAERRAGARAGQGLVEYSLIVVLIAVAVIAAMSAMGGQIQAVITRSTASLTVP